MISCFNAAKNHCSQNQLKGPIILGDFNARYTAWGDSRSKGYGKNLLDFCGSEGFVVSSPYEATFVNSHFNAVSVFDLYLCDYSVCNLLSNVFVDKEVELFTGALSVGHWPICYELNITKPVNYSEVRHCLIRVNWEYLSSVLKMDVEENFDVLIEQFPSTINQRTYRKM